MSFVRIRLTFQRTLALTEVKNCWFLVDTSTCSTIADLEYLIKKRFKGLSKSCHSVNLFLDDFLLPSQEKIEIIQNNDNIRVEMQQMITTHTVNDGERNGQVAEKKVEQKRKKSSLSDARNKPKKKRVVDDDDDDDDDDGVLSDKRRKRDNLPKKRVQDDNEIQKESKKAKREKKSPQDSKKLEKKEPTKEKAAHKRHKPNVPSVVASDGSSLVGQEKTRPMKGFSSPLTSTISSQLSKPNKPSKRKSTMEHKPSSVTKVSSKANIHQIKNNSVLLKRNSKKSKTSGIGKYFDSRNGINSDTDSSESSSSTESSSSESSDESGPSNSQSKVNGSTASLMTSVTKGRANALINTDRSGKDAQNKMSTEMNGKQGKDETDATSQSSLTSRGISDGARSGRSFSSSSNSSNDMDEPEDTMLKNARLSSSLPVSAPSHLSSSSSENGKENSKIENISKKTSSSLLNPLSSSLSSFPSPSVDRRTQMWNTNETPVNKAAGVRPQLCTSRIKNKKPGSGHSTGHIRFDSEESEEESFEERQQDIGLTSDTTEHVNNTAPSPSMLPSKQNQPKTSETALSELKESATRDYSLCMPLHGAPRSRDKIAFKLLELSASYTPEISSYKEGTVLAFDPSSGDVKIKLTKASLKKTQGDGNVTRKFDLVYDESEEDANDEEDDTEIVVLWNSMIDPVLVE